MLRESFSIVSNLVDVHRREVYPARIVVRDGIIAAIERHDSIPNSFLIPGLVDAHVHIESSMLVPAEFARAAVVHGTVGTVSDPHEIANVLGCEGVEYMLENAASVPFKFWLRS
jgi:adenine deaminase